jgi:hypothetical protein
MRKEGGREYTKTLGIGPGRRRSRLLVCRRLPIHPSAFIVVHCLQRRLKFQKCEKQSPFFFPERLLLAAEIGNDLRADGSEFGRFAHRGGRPGLRRAGRHEAQPAHGRARIRDAQERFHAAQLGRVRY